MLWKKARRSDNLEDARSTSGGIGLGRRKGLSLGGIAVLLAIALLTGQDPLQMLSQLLGQSADTVPSLNQQRPLQRAPTDDTQREFVRAILGDTEDTWGAIFQHAGRQYQPPTLVLFSAQVESACGFASAAAGPFYCPADRRVYLDLGFFKELEQRFAAAGDFAQAYVIAHEVGHHVQTLLGISAKIATARSQGQKMAGDNGLRVRQELQADCLAGLWAGQAQKRLNWLEPGDIEEALNAASAIGDDRLQQQNNGQLMPDAFSHGTSAQRVHWFKRGFEGSDINSCNTFATGPL